MSCWQCFILNSRTKEVHTYVRTYVHSTYVVRSYIHNECAYVYTRSANWYAKVGSFLLYTHGMCTQCMSMHTYVHTYMEHVQSTQ